MAILLCCDELLPPIGSNLLLIGYLIQPVVTSQVDFSGWFLPWEKCS